MLKNSYCIGEKGIQLEKEEASSLKQPMILQPKTNKEIKENNEDKLPIPEETQDDDDEDSDNESVSSTDEEIKEFKEKSIKLEQDKCGFFFSN